MLVFSRVTTILLVSFMVSCGQYADPVILPDGTNLANKRIRDLKKKYNLVFFQYEGFKGMTSNSHLITFLIIAQHPPSDILSSAEIAMMEDEYVKGIVFFETVPQEMISFNDFVVLVQNEYDAHEVRYLSSNEAVIMKNKMKMCAVKYVAHVPGYMVTWP